MNTIALLLALTVLAGALLFLDQPREHEDLEERNEAQQRMRDWLDERRRDDDR